MSDAQPSQMIAEPPLPAIDENSEPFWEAAARGELVVQVCGSCGRLRFPPRPMCPACHSLDIRWQKMSGNGTVWSYVVPHPPLLPAFQPLAPYNVIVVALDEDPTIRMVGNLLASADGAINEIDPATIHIGEPVSVVFQQVAEDVHLPRWVRAS
jgi:uncharacterized protein